MIPPHWSPDYKAMAQASFDRDKSRLQEQIEQAVELGLWSADKAREADKKAQGLDRLQIGGAITKMHRILKGK